jgi:hypothetical protein
MDFAPVSSANNLIWSKTGFLSEAPPTLPEFGAYVGTRPAAKGSVIPPKTTGTVVNTFASA